MLEARKQPGHLSLPIQLRYTSPNARKTKNEERHRPYILVRVWSQFSKASIAVEGRQSRGNAWSDIQHQRKNQSQKQVNTSRTPPSSNAEYFLFSAFPDLFAHDLPTSTSNQKQTSNQWSLAIARTVPGLRQAHITFGASPADSLLIRHPSPCPRRVAYDRHLGTPPNRQLVGC